MCNIIEVNNLTKIYKVHKRKPGLINGIKDLFVRKYQSVVALKQISFSVKEGELLGYIGPNGAGKTTTLKILSGILYPTEGDVQVMGFIPAERRRDFLMNISFIMGQKHQLWWDIPPMETFLLNKEIYNIPYSIFRERLDELIEMFKVGDLIYTPVRKLSLGERMKMEIIASLLHAPKVLFLDEPTIGLDLISQESIRKFLMEYNQKYKATILLTSHYIRDIEIICNRIIIINKGRKIFDGSKSEILGKFLQERILKIRFKKLPADVKKIGFDISCTEKQCELKVPTSEVKSVIDQLSKKNDIEEISIEELKLEDAIKEVFKNASIFENH